MGMENILVIIIVAGAIGFTIRGFIRAYKGESTCNCGGCSCSSKDNCNQDFPISDATIIDKK